MTQLRNDRLIPAVTKSTVTRVPKSRPEYDKRTKEVFKIICLDLINRGRFEKISTHVVIQYCDSFYVYMNAMDQIFAEEKLTTKDRNTDRKSPLFQIKKQEMDTMLILDKRLGITPYSRDRITEAETIEDEDHLDGL